MTTTGEKFKDHKNGNLEITLPPPPHTRQFDDPTTHGVGECLKRVDFIFEDGDEIVFLEIKDYDHPNASSENRADDYKSFMHSHFDCDYAQKYRDSFLYEWAFGRHDGKTLKYYVVVGIQLSERDLIKRTEGLRRKLPVDGTSIQGWSRNFVTGCGVYNLTTWNKYFPQYPINRVTG